KLPLDPTGTNLVAPLKLLNRLVSEPADQPMRAQLVAWLNASLKQQFKIEEPAGADATALRKAYQPIFDFIGAKYPGLLRLMNAVVFPSRDIAPAYRTMTFRLRNGESYTGIVAFESADGWIVQTGAGATARIDSANVVSRQPGNVSVMPSGLLTGLNAQGLA